MATKKTTSSGTKPTAKTTSKSTQKSAPQKRSAPKKSAAKKGKGGTNVSAAQRKKNLERVAKANKRKNTFAQFVPFILFAVALILAVLLILNWISRDFMPGSRLEGEIGMYICQYALFGVFGYASFLFPALLVIFGIFWFKTDDGTTRAIKALLSVMIVASFSAMIHIFVAMFSAGLFGESRLIDHMDTKFGQLFLASADLQAGGLLGGYLGWVLSYAFDRGAPFVLLFCLIILFLVLLEITPVQIWNKIKASNAKRQTRARMEEDDEEEDEDEDEFEPVPVFSKKKNARDRAEYEDEDAYEYDDEYDDEPASASTKKKNKKKTRATDPEDEDEDEFEPIPIFSKKKNNKKTRDEDEDLDDDGYRVDPETGEMYELDSEPEPEKPARKGRKSKKKASFEDEDDDIGFKPLNLGDEDAEQEQRSDPYASQPVPDAEDAGASEPEKEPDFVYDQEPMAEFEVDLEDDDASYQPIQRTRKSKRSEPEPEPEFVDETEALLDDLLDEEIPEEGQEQTATEVEYVFPTTDMLAAGSAHYHTSEEEVAANTEVLRQTLEDFHIRVKEVTCSTGPTVTRYEIKPEAGVRVRAIANLVDDIALGLAKSGVRIEAPIPGKAAVGIEVPNDKPATVYLRNLLESPEFINHKSKVAVCLGADVSGRPVVFDIEKMPHLLVAGATGMGKSVCINCLVMSLLYKASPKDVKLIMVDPKKVEFTMYRDIPHLYCPIVSDPKKAAGALASAVSEMERRFSLIEEVGVRNITGYNELTKDDPEKEYLPRIVIIIDELADLMMTAPDDVETCICRLAQKARAAGIHIIIGTQRPSVDVVTGLIKANIPSRIAFTVSSQVDSRTIIDVGGAEKLIGRGDMLYAPVGAAKPQRVQGAFVADGEVERVVNFVKTQNGAAKYNDSFTKQIEEEAAKCGNGKKGGSSGGDGDFGGGGDGEDEKLWEAVEVVVTEGKASTSMLQRYLKVGYGRAAGLLDRMEELGFISAQDGNKPRKVLVTKQDLDELRMNGKAE